MPQKNTQHKNTNRKDKQNPNETFRTKSRAAALQQSKLHMEKQQNRSFLKINESELTKSPTIECITISDSTQDSPIKVYTSNNPHDFMITSPSSPEIKTNYTFKISTPKIDKVVEKIHRIKNSPTLTSSPILNVAIPSGSKTNKEKQIETEQTKDTIETTTKTDNQQPAKCEQEKPITPNENEEHYIANASPAKSSISDIKPGDFFDEEFHE